MIEISRESIEAIRNEYREICDMLTPNVILKRLIRDRGSLCLWEFTVNAPTYYITGAGDVNPKRTDSIIFYLDIRNGYPRTKPSVYYGRNKILASVNTFTSGSQCTDEWHFDEQNSGKNSTLESIVRKTVMDIIHDPSVTRFDSMANHYLYSWQKKMFESGALPSCSIGRVLKLDVSASSGDTHMDLPKRSSVPGRGNPPALPPQRRWG